MLRRGLQVSALREFILQQGASKNVTVQEWDKIWTFNKKLIDPVCPRHTAIEIKDRVPVRISAGPDPPEYVDVPRHNKYPPAGTKKQLRSNLIWLDQADAAQIADGEEVTLMGWGNAIIERIEREDSNDAVAASDGNKSSHSKVVAMDARLHLEGNFKKTKLKLTWLAETPELVPLELHHFGYLLTKRKLEEEDEFEEFVNRNSVSDTSSVLTGNSSCRMTCDCFHAIAGENGDKPSCTCTCFGVLMPFSFINVPYCIVAADDLSCSWRSQPS